MGEVRVEPVLIAWSGLASVALAVAASFLPAVLASRGSVVCKTV